MAEEGGLEKKLKGYNESIAIGQVGGLVATAATIYGGFNYPQLLASYAPFAEPLLYSSVGLFGLGMISNFIGDQVGFGASLYAYNRERYKGMSGKSLFVKDYLNLGIRHFGSYFITYPLAGVITAAAIGTGLLTGPLAFILPYAVESLITGIGYLASTFRFRKRAYST